MTNLNEVQGLNTYCGPAVLAALTGKSTDMCAAVISKISGQREIKAVQIHHLLQALDKLGFNYESQSFGASLYGTIIDLVIKRKFGFFIVLVPRHVVALEITDEKKVYFIDNHTKHAINAAASARLSQRVEGLYYIKEKPKPSIKDIAKERILYLTQQLELSGQRIQYELDRRDRFQEELDRLNKEILDVQS